MADALISIICPYYNRQEYIEFSIKSILEQTYKNIDILLVNDGSTDDSRHIAHSFKDNRITHLDINHQGCWKAKNQGIKKAKGELICFIDSDDFISQDYLNIAIKTINKNPDFDYYYPGSLTIANEDGSKTGSIWRYIDYPNNKRHNLIYLYYHNLIGGIPHAGALIRKHVFADKLYDDSLINLADTVFVVKNALNIKFFLLKEHGQYFNRQHQSQTNKNTKARCKAFSELIYYIWENYPAKYYLPDISDKIEVADNVVQRLMSLQNEYGNICDYYAQSAQKILTWIRQSTHSL